MFKNVLMVCIGNICRSPVAEYFLKTHFEKNNIDAQVASAGVAALVDQPADQNSIDVMTEKYSIDLTGHTAQQITQEIATRYDLILTMEESQKKHIEQAYPFARGKVRLLGHWREEEIIDPYKKPKEAFIHMAKHIDTCLNDWVKQYWQPQGESTCHAKS